MVSHVIDNFYFTWILIIFILQVAPAKCSLFIPSSPKTSIQITLQSTKPAPRQKRTRVKRKKRAFRRLSIDRFDEEYGDALIKNVLEMCDMKLTSRKLKTIRYSNYQKWLSRNLMIAASKKGYKVMRQWFELPHSSTISRCIDRLKSKPGLCKWNAILYRMKVDLNLQETTGAYFSLMKCRSGWPWVRRKVRISGWIWKGLYQQYQGVG